MSTRTYHFTRQHLAAVLDEAERSREPGLVETVRLLRSPRNAARLLAALEQSRRGEGAVYTTEALARTLASRGTTPDARGAASSA